MADLEVTADFLRGNPLPLPEGEIDKDARGRVMVVGGHREVPGAALLAAVSVLRAGAGKVQVATCQSAALALGIAIPEAKVFGLSEAEGGDIAAGNAPAIVARALDGEIMLLGPGMLDGAEAGQLARTILSTLSGQNFVVDAAALTGLAGQHEVFLRHAGRIVITPHAGEMATFLQLPIEQVQDDPIRAARQAADHTGAIVILKGSCTHIAVPQGEVWQCRQGNVGLATSGSGDTLAGVIAGLMARGSAPLLAAQWGVYLHAEAGQRLRQKHGLLGYLAREIPAEIPAIMRDFGGA